MRRPAAALACLLDFGGGVGAVCVLVRRNISTLRHYGLFPAPPSTNPLDAKGFKANLPEQIPIGGPMPDQSGDMVVRGGHSSGTFTLPHLEGGFVAEYKGYRMEGDVLDGNRRSQVYIISGNAVLTGPDAVVTARRIVVDYQNRTYEAYDGEKEMRPSLVGGVLQTDMYSKARRGNRNGKEQFSR